MERSGRRSRRLVPGERACVLAGYRVQRAGRVASALKLLQCLAAHRRVDMQIRNTDDCTHLLEHEEDRAVVDQAAPVAAPNQVALDFAQTGTLEFPFEV